MDARGGADRKTCGFTLSEILIVTAVISIIAAVSIPAYARIKTVANAEMVKQHLRVIGEKMAEILGRNGQYPDPSRWPFTDSTDIDEKEITSNLSAIENSCFTVSKDDYVSNSLRSEYSFRTCPKKTSECAAYSGNNCFIVHANIKLSAQAAPGAILSVNPTSSLGIPMNQNLGLGTQLLPNPNLPKLILNNDVPKTQLLSAYLKTLAFSLDTIANDVSLYGCQSKCSGSFAYTYGTQVFLPSGGLDNAALSAVWSSAAQNLEMDGIQMYWTKQVINNDVIQQYAGYEIPPDSELYDVVFQLNERVNNIEELASRSNESNAQLDAYFPGLRSLSPNITDDL